MMKTGKQIIDEALATKLGKLQEGVAETLGRLRRALPRSLAGQHGPAQPIFAPAMPRAASFTAALDGLAERLADLGLRTPDLAPDLAPVPPTADGRFEERSFTNEAGSRQYKIFVPAGYRGQPMPLVVMLHGCTQSPDDFAAGTRMNELAAAETFIVVYPAQSRSANMSKCWNWFKSEDQRRDHGEPSIIAGITREVIAEFGVKPRHVFIAGLSAGGAAAAIMGAQYPDLYAAVGVHSGLACGAARSMAMAGAAMRRGAATRGAPPPNATLVPTIVFHGDRDSTVNVVNAAQIATQARAGQMLEDAVTEGATADGVRYTRHICADAGGQPRVETWILHGAGHAWSGGSPAGSYTDTRGPDASREMLKFFMRQTRSRKSLW